MGIFRDVIESFNTKHGVFACGPLTKQAEDCMNKWKQNLNVVIDM